MRFSGLVFAALAAAAQAPDTKEYQEAICPSTPRLEMAPSSEHWLLGSIGQKQVRIYLERGGEAVVGVLYDAADWVPLLLGGHWTDGGIVELTGRTEHDTLAGQLRGQLAADGLAGSWTPQGAIQKEPVRLKTVPPMKCDEYQGNWLPFSDPRWPVTFSYPASWRLQADGDAVTLTCPDPSVMAYSDFNIRVTHGSSVKEGEGAFTRCAGQWKYGRQCDCDNLGACRDAEISRQNGIAVLAGDEMEWRIYCRNGGYIAQGFGYDRLLLMGSRWVEMSGQGPPSELIAEILKTVRRR